jgi:hypothetical protein
VSIFALILFSGAVGAVLGGIVVAITLSNILKRNDALQKQITADIDRLHN